MKYVNKFACLWLIIVVVGVMWLASCSDLRHYRAVADDHNRNEAKRSLLAPVCAAEFPPKVSDDTTIRESLRHVRDTTGETRLRNSLDSLSKLLASKPGCPQLNTDSLITVIRATLKPDTVYKDKMVSITRNRIDSAQARMLQDIIAGAKAQITKIEFSYDQLQGMNKQQLAEIKALKDDRNNPGANLKYFCLSLIKQWWFWLIMAGITGVWWLTGRSNIFSLLTRN